MDYALITRHGNREGKIQIIAECPCQKVRMIEARARCDRTDHHTKVAITCQYLIAGGFFMSVMRDIKQTRYQNRNYSNNYSRSDQ